MMILVNQLIFDERNRKHIKKHQVMQSEIEKSFADEYAVFISGYNDRIILLGRSGERLITTVVQRQTIDTLYYVVTARDMAKKERAIYRLEKAKKEQNYEK